VPTRAAQNFRHNFGKFCCRAPGAVLFSPSTLLPEVSEPAITRRRQPKSRHDEQKSSRGLFVVSAGGDSSSLV
jgi:hypothetical protein